MSKVRRKAETAGGKKKMGNEKRNRKRSGGKNQKQGRGCITPIKNRGVGQEQKCRKDSKSEGQIRKQDWLLCRYTE